MKNGKAIVFDMDGLLLDTESIAYRVFNKVIQQHGLSVDLKTYAKFSGLRKKDFLNAVKRELNNLENTEKVINYFYKKFEDELFMSSPNLKKGCRELIRYLKKNDIPIALATSTHKMLAIHLLNKTNLLKYFEVIVTGDMIDKGKPSPNIFLKAFKKLRIDNHEAIILEDSANGIRAAYASGGRAILIPGLKMPSEEVQRLATEVYSSLADFLNDLKRGCF